MRSLQLVVCLFWLEPQCQQQRFLQVARDTLIVVALGALIFKTVVEPRLVKDKNNSVEPRLPKDKPALPAEL